MERTIIIYKSKYGSTQKYAQWIGEELDCPVVSASDFPRKDFEKYTNIIFGGCVHAGGIMGLDLIKKNFRHLDGKKIVIFAVGLNVMEQENRMQLREINFDKKRLNGLTCYYCPGAYDPSKIKGIDGAVIKMMKRMLENKKPEETTEADEKLLSGVTNGTDMTDRKYIEPIIKEFKE